MSVAWRDDETAFLRDNLNKLGIKACAERLGKTYIRVSSRAYHLGLIKEVSPSWQPHEIDLLKKHFSEDGAEFIASKIDRTVAAVKTKGRALGLMLPRGNRKKKTKAIQRDDLPVAAQRERHRRNYQQPMHGTSRTHRAEREAMRAKLGVFQKVARIANQA